MPVPEFFFHASCDHHDFNYWLGCTEADREKADNEFYEAMKQDVGWKWWRLPLAWTYYMAVRICGGACFHYADRERDENDLAAAMEEGS